MSPNLSGKVAIVTGAASGIGRTTAATLARAGAAVAIADLNLTGAQQVADSIMADGGRAIAVGVDIAVEDQIKAMVDTTVRELGRLDIVHANAALTSPAVISRDGGIADIDAALFAKVLGVNVIGSALTAKYAAAHMAGHGGGVIIFTTSQESVLGEIVRSMYSASKAAIESIMRDTATQYGAAGIRAVSVSPGLILTEGMHSVPQDFIDRLTRHNLLPRLGAPENIADTVAFLASDAAGYITGISIPIDGGMLQHFPNFADERDAATNTRH
ncbi:SDR family oxidoreductase [Streptosporangium sp. NPDC002544]|uniref:SDR family NAD(P)-dependent oxidoreductase n=1 Tax=Streptosporangium sp. NPDC002544 TaxID=3154538 RepID=UPI003324DFC3